MNVKSFFPACLWLFFLSCNCHAQANLPQDVIANASDPGEVVQRVLQYELVIGYELEAKLAACVDEELQKTWMLPEKAEAELSNKAIERVRRRLEICQAGGKAIPNAGGSPGDYRLTTEMRSSLESQLKAARALELSKKPAKDCLAKSDTTENLKACLNAALASSPSESVWSKWLVLFERRTAIASIK